MNHSVIQRAIGPVRRSYELAHVIVVLLRWLFARLLSPNFVKKFWKELPST